MSDSTDPLAWVGRAEEDYLLIRSALRRKKPLTNGACFHAQQCAEKYLAEKYLKAILIGRKFPFSKTHDLLALSTLCAQAGFQLGVDLDQLDTLSSYAVQVRYPAADLTIEEANRALKVAQLVRRAVQKALGIKAKKKGGTSPRPLIPPP